MPASSGLLGGKSPFGGGGESIKETVKYGKAERVRVEQEVEDAKERAKRAQRVQSGEFGDSENLDEDSVNTPDAKAKPKTVPPLAGVF